MHAWLVCMSNRDGAWRWWHSMFGLPCIVHLSVDVALFKDFERFGCMYNNVVDGLCWPLNNADHFSGKEEIFEKGRGQTRLVF